MPRPVINLEPFRDLIIELHQGKNSTSTIASILQNQHDIQVKERTIRDRLRKWEESHSYQVTEDSPQLRLRITTLFLECQLKDDEILEVLSHEGYQTSRWGLIRVRKELGLSRRSTGSNREEEEQQLKEIVQMELDKGTIQGYGRGYLYTHL